MRDRLAALLLAAAGVAGIAGGPLAGCYETPKPECAFLCGAADACPDDYRCTDDGWCKRDDVPAAFECPDEREPDAAPPADAGPDAAAADAA